MISCAENNPAIGRCEMLWKAALFLVLIGGVCVFYNELHPDLSVYDSRVSITKDVLNGSPVSGGNLQDIQWSIKYDSSFKEALRNASITDDDMNKVLSKKLFLVKAIYSLNESEIENSSQKEE